jgi:hypothetical protein
MKTKFIAKVLCTPVLAVAALCFGFLMIWDIEFGNLPLAANFLISVPLKISAAILMFTSTFTAGYLWSKDDEGPYLLYLKSQFKAALQN